MRPTIDDATVELLQRAMGRMSLRLALVASNLANVDTPGYRARRVEFLDALRAAQPEPELLQRTHPLHLEGGAEGPERPLVVEAPVTRIRADGNTVDIDVEMSRLAAVQGEYTAAANLLRKRFALLRYALSEGRA
jgi:flagellar basal-body rod protein FlgB